MLNRDIADLQEKINRMVIDGSNKDEIYNMSVNLDKLIVRFYSENQEKRKV